MDNNMMEWGCQNIFAFNIAWKIFWIFSFVYYKMYTHGFLASTLPYLYYNNNDNNIIPPCTTHYNTYQKKMRVALTYPQIYLCLLVVRIKCF
jgi:hypothetical protein